MDKPEDKLYELVRKLRSFHLADRKKLTQVSGEITYLLKSLFDESFQNRNKVLIYLDEIKRSCPEAFKMIIERDQTLRAMSRELNKLKFYKRGRR